MKFCLENELTKVDYEIVLTREDEINASDEEKKILEFVGFGDTGFANLPGSRKVFVKVDENSCEGVRLAAGKGIKSIKSYDVKNVKINLVEIEGLDALALASALVEGIILASYSFDKYKSEAKALTIQNIGVNPGTLNETDVLTGIKQGKIIAEATNYVRDLINEIPQVYTPEAMAQDAIRLKEELGDAVEVEAFGADYLKDQNMNAFLAVNQSSPNEPRLIHLAYKPDAECAKKIAFVGKGLTYDSGGLSLKPNSSMCTMKDDMSGAAAALGILKASAELKLPVEVHAVLGCTENMIGADAYKPDDIIKSRAGVTIEVTNTDAEGRLVLADCLSWACDMIKPDLIVDLATLTGACIVGLGEYTTAVLGRNYALQDEYKKLAEKSGEYYTVLESNRYLDKILDSKIADIRNSAPGTTGGAITAGVFLSKFMPEDYREKWIHLDLGPAFAESEWGYNPVGGTGAGVRGAIYYLLQKRN